MTERHTYLAVDGGNSKTHLVVGDSEGRVLAFVRGPGSSPHYLGVPGSIALLDALVTRALADARLPPGTVLDRAEVYIAGADLPVEVDVLTKAVGEAGWAREHRVDNDLFALLRAGTSAADAVAVVCGAGINCVGRTADGRTARFPSLGTVSGDWGGGHHLAELEKQQVRELSPVLFAVAAAGDPVARGVVAKQAREVIALATIAARRLGLLDKPHAVVLGGGVLAARHALLHDAVVDGIQAAAPQATIGIVADPPVAGAALLALDAFAANTPEVERAVRAAIRGAAAG